MAKKKDVLVLIVDTGSLAGLEEYDDDGCNTTFFQQSMKCIKQVLQRKIFSESKDEIALITFGSESTNNPLSQKGGYKNISIERELLPVTWEFIEFIEKKLQTNSAIGDFVDAIIVALDHINAKINKNFKVGEKFLYLFAPLRNSVCDDKLETVTSALVNFGIRLNIIGPPVKDEKDTKESLKMFVKSKEVASKLVEMTQGLWYPFKDTMDSISQILPRLPNAMPWKTNLKIGNLEIPISAYLKIKKYQLKSMKKGYKEDKSAKLLNERTYHKFDESQTQCDSQDIVERYRYGSSLVIYTEEDKANMEYQGGGKCLSVLGFTKLEHVKRHHYLGTGVHYIFSDNKHHHSEIINVSLSAIIRALYETRMVAIARKVYSNRSAPIIGFLMPLVKVEYECLVFIQLPFMEDLRLFTFPSLNMEEITTDELQIVDDLIDNLSPKIKSDENAGLLNSVDNPYTRRLFQCISHRVLHPEAPLLELDTNQNYVFKLSKQKLEACVKTTDNLLKCFNLQKVEQAKKRTGDSTFHQNLGEEVVQAKLLKLGSDVNDVAFTESKVTAVGTVTPVEDFAKIIFENPLELVNASKQMEKVVIGSVIDSVGGDLLRQEMHKKTIKCLEVLRKELLKDHPANYNHFIVELKNLILNKKNIQLWDMICQGKIGLINREESSNSTLTKEESEVFFKIEEGVEIEEPNIEDDLDDLVGEM